MRYRVVIFWEAIIEFDDLFSSIFFFDAIAANFLLSRFFELGFIADLYKEKSKKKWKISTVIKIYAVTLFGQFAVYGIIMPRNQWKLYYAYFGRYGWNHFSRNIIIDYIIAWDMVAAVWWTHYYCIIVWKNLKTQKIGA